jgi:hypothetical protein
VSLPTLPASVRSWQLRQRRIAILFFCTLPKKKWPGQMPEHRPGQHPSPGHPQYDVRPEIPTAASPVTRRASSARSLSSSVIPQTQSDLQTTSYQVFRFCRFVARWLFHARLTSSWRGLRSSVVKLYSDAWS